MSSETKTAFDFTEVLATYRRQCEEWGAGNGDAWLDRLQATEEVLHAAWLHRASSSSSAARSPDQPSGGTLSEEERSIVRGCRTSVRNWTTVDVTTLRLLLGIVDRLAGEGLTV